MRSLDIGAALVGLSLVASASACKWTDFDDLEEDAWVHSFEKPDNKSTNWGVAIQRSSASGAGAKLAVIGATVPLYNLLGYDAVGDASVDNEVRLGDLGLTGLSPEPFLLADPTKDEIALVTSGNASVITVIRGSGGQLFNHNIFGPAVPDAAAFMVAPGAGSPLPQQPQPLVAEGDRVYGTFYTPGPGFQQPKCKLVDGASPVMVRALASFRRADDSDDVIVWSAANKLHIFAGGIFNGALSSNCPDLTPGDSDTTGTASPIATYDIPATTFAPISGSQILVFDNRYAVLQGHDAGGAGFLGLFDLMTGLPIGTPRADSNLKHIALLPLNGKQYVVAGYPATMIDGVSAGQVLVFEVDTTGGIGKDAAGTELKPLTLHDAEPEADQSFGRSVAVVPFGGKPTIAVAADNEVFFYYRTNLYPDVRSGR